MQEAAIAVQEVTQDPRTNSVCVRLSPELSIRQKRRVRRRLASSDLLTRVSRVQEYIVAKPRRHATMEKIYDLVHQTVEAVLALTATAAAVLTPRRQRALVIEITTPDGRRRKSKQRSHAYHNVPPAPRRLNPSRM